MRIVLFTTALLAVFCGFSCQENDTPLAIINAPLEGTTWRLQKIIQDTGTENVPTEEEITAIFQAGQLTGNGGCNDYFSTYTVAGDQLSITTVSSTLKLCAQRFKKAGFQFSRQ